MRIPLSWINQFTPLPKLSVAEIGRRFTLGACEVEGIHCEQELWSQVQLVEILSIEPHPKAARLSFLTISNGSTKMHLVCGADNLYLGLKTFWAPEGTEIEGTVLKNREIMGVFSRGMLCSERELNLSTKHDGIIDLTEFCRSPQQLGMNFAELLAHNLKFGEALKLPSFKKLTGPIPEFILDIDNKSLTHRPDMWGVLGMAREFGALFPETTASKKLPYGKSRFQAGHAKQKQQKAPSPVSISIAKDSSCLSYCALAIDGLQIGESPEWMQKRLKMSGVNVINSIVDVSNYVMLERGAPNHIFDRDRLAGEQICVYTLKADTDFTTLDGQRRQLQEGDTVVADSKKPQVIAGIMGGEESSVRDSTQNILLELAVWDSYQTHKTSMRLGLRTDSSLRYEKSLDPFSIEDNLWRLCEVILDCHPGAKVRGELQRYYRDETGREACSIATSAAKISQVLGHPVDEQLIEQIFCNLGFSVQKTAGKMLVQVPSFRTSKDISIEEDLIEEVGRIIGFDKIVPQPPLAELRPSSLGADSQLARKIRNFLVLNGSAQEVLSYPLIGAKLLEQCSWQNKNEELRLANPLNPEQDRMRPSLIPNHLELAGRNAHKFSQFRLFELGRSYGEEREQQQLLISVYGENPILELRNICERLLAHLLGRQTEHQDWQNSPKDLPDFPELQNWAGRHPTECIHWQSPQREQSLPQTCIVFSVHPALLRSFKLKGKLAMASIPLGPVTLPKEQRKAQKSPKLCFSPLKRFPSVSFDCTVVLQPKVFATEAVHALEQYIQYHEDMLARYLQAVFVRDLYPAPDQSGTRWLTLQCIFSASDKTLEGQEITALENQVLQVLKKADFPLKHEHK